MLTLTSIFVTIDDERERALKGSDDGTPTPAASGAA
jgi:hypothetical protein